MRALKKGGGFAARHEVHPVDRHVGERLRLARISSGISQTDVARSVGVTFQQIQKYEKGTNRVSASRLFEIANLFKLPVSYFFEGASAASTRSSAAGPPIQRVDLEILDTLVGIHDRVLKRKFLELIAHFART